MSRIEDLSECIDSVKALRDFLAIEEGDAIDSEGRDLVKRVTEAVITLESLKEKGRLWLQNSTHGHALDAYMGGKYVGHVYGYFRRVDLVLGSAIEVTDDRGKVVARFWLSEDVGIKE